MTSPNESIDCKGVCITSVTIILGYTILFSVQQLTSFV
jgi:hypothetical protein